ncbi:ribonuclease P protein subunit p21-like [Tubulanus polymorphus]|uniref:ribonuclease P protein subunit p21-like n=1 Tax=Tubulanus polymorphus TaxID=672921 RepID=UPI003DA21CB6
MGKPKSSYIAGRESFQRINYLFQCAMETLKSNPRNVELVRFYCKALKTVARKQVLKLDPTIKRKICRRCDVLLLPGVTCCQRTRMKSRVVTCTECGDSRRYPYNKQQKLWCEQKQAWTDT